MSTRLACALLGCCTLLGIPAAAAPGTARFRAQRAEAARAFRLLQRNQRGATVHWQAHRTRPALLLGLSLAVPGATPVQRARRFLGRHPALFVPAHQLEPVEVRASGELQVVRFRQRFRGLEVTGVTASVALDRCGRIRSVRSDLEPIPASTATRPRLDPDGAVRAAYAALYRRTPSTTSGVQPELVIVPGPTPRLAYRLLLPTTDAPLGRFHLVGADGGRYLGSTRGVVARWEVRR